MKVAMVINSLEVGGAEISLENLCNAISKDVTLQIITLSGVGLIGTRMRERGYLIHECELNKSLSSFKNFFKLILLLRRFKPDVVHTWMYHSNLLGGIAAKLAGINKIVWSIHNFNVDKGMIKTSTRILIRISAIFSYLIPKTIICCSQNSLETHSALFYKNSKLFFLPNGVDDSLFKHSIIGREQVRKEFQIKEHEIVVGLVGRYDVQKNQLGFLKALSKNKKIAKRYTYFFVGRGNDSENKSLVEKIYEFELEDKIKLLGEREDIQHILSAMDIFVLPSLGEAFPISLCEAMLCEVPSIATDVGDINFILDGILNPIQTNDLDSITSIIHAIASMPVVERRKIGQKLRDRIVKSFSMDIVSKKHLNLYESI